MPQFFFFDLLLISSVSSSGALADYYSLHLLSGSNGSGKEKRGRGKGKEREGGQTQGEMSFPSLSLRLGGSGVLLL